MVDRRRVNAKTVVTACETHPLTQDIKPNVVGKNIDIFTGTKQRYVIPRAGRIVTKSTAATIWKSRLTVESCLD